jgi:hypothetical protein
MALRHLSDRHSSQQWGHSPGLVVSTFLYKPSVQTGTLSSLATLSRASIVLWLSVAHTEKPGTGTFVGAESV